MAPLICRTCKEQVGSSKRVNHKALASLTLPQSGCMALIYRPALYSTLSKRALVGARLMWTLKILRKIPILKTGSSQPSNSSSSSISLTRPSAGAHKTSASPGQTRTGSRKKDRAQARTRASIASNTPNATQAFIDYQCSTCSGPHQHQQANRINPYLGQSISCKRNSHDLINNLNNRGSRFQVHHSRLSKHYYDSQSTLNRELRTVNLIIHIIVGVLTKGEQIKKADWSDRPYKYMGARFFRC